MTAQSHDHDRASPDTAEDTEIDTTRGYDGLVAYAHAKAEANRVRIDRAFRALQRAHQPINFSTVAASAGVSRGTVYRHHKVADKIRRERQNPRTAAAEQSSTNARPATSDNGIAGALRQKIRAQEEVIRQLRREIRDRDESLAIAHAEIERLTPP